jgi:hypothetical protein
VAAALCNTSWAFGAEGGQENPKLRVPILSDKDVPRAANPANGTKFKLTMLRTACEHTQESGKDEVFIKVIGKDPKGRIVEGVAPTSRIWWDFHERGESHRREQRNVRLYGDTLGPGQACVFFVLFMERDETRFDELYDTYRKELQGPIWGIPRFGGSKDAIDDMKRALNVVLEEVRRQIEEHSDECLGAVHVSIRNDGGKIRSLWEPVDHAERISSDDALSREWKAARPHCDLFRLKGKGANYCTVLEVGQD